MSEPVELHAWAGGQIDADSHGDVTIGVRSGNLRADLYTDTLELAFEPAGEHGKAWLFARACGFAGGMMISPWTDGAPDPGRSMPVGYLGVEGGAQRWGPIGLWVGLQGEAREYVAYGVGSIGPVLRADATGGLWTTQLQASLRAGAHVAAMATAPLQPHLEGDVHWRADWRVGPIVEGWGAVADNQDAVTLSRVGGLTPYVVPLPGAAWAEWWVEDYAVGRVGIAAGSVGMVGTVVPKVLARGTLSAVLAAFSTPHGGSTAMDGPTHGAAGLEASGSLTYKHFYTDLAVGYAPWIRRQAGISRASTFFRVGLDWTALRGKSRN